MRGAPKSCHVRQLVRTDGSDNADIVQFEVYTKLECMELMHRLQSADGSKPLKVENFPSSVG
jgi:hypothetical protein